MFLRPDVICDCFVSTTIPLLFKIIFLELLSNSSWLFPRASNTKPWQGYFILKGRKHLRLTLNKWQSWFIRVPFRKLVSEEWLPYSSILMQKFCSITLVTIATPQLRSFISQSVLRINCVLIWIYTVPPIKCGCFIWYTYLLWLSKNVRVYLSLYIWEIVGKGCVICLKTNLPSIISAKIAKAYGIHLTN